jgi:hypothetical protein
VPWIQNFTRYKNSAGPANFNPRPSPLLGQMLANVSLFLAI